MKSLFKSELSINIAGIFFAALGLLYLIVLMPYVEACFPNARETIALLMTALLLIVETFFIAWVCNQEVNNS